MNTAVSQGEKSLNEPTLRWGQRRKEQEDEERKNKFEVWFYWIENKIFSIWQYLRLVVAAPWWYLN